MNSHKNKQMCHLVPTEKNIPNPCFIHTYRDLMHSTKVAQNLSTSFTLTDQSRWIRTDRDAAPHTR